jgi:hypothetical protein
MTWRDSVAGSDETMKVWYIKDSKGVSSIFTNHGQARAGVSSHNEHVARTRGHGVLHSKRVLVSDWQAEKITTATIEAYEMG